MILIAINLICCLHDDEKNNLETLEDALRDTVDTGYTGHTVPGTVDLGLNGQRGHRGDRGHRETVDTGDKGDTVDNLERVVVKKFVQKV